MFIVRITQWISKKENINDYTHATIRSVQRNLEKHSIDLNKTNPVLGKRLDDVSNSIDSLHQMNDAKFKRESDPDRF